MRKAPGAAKGTPTKKVKKETEEEKNVWKWWEEEKSADGRKWTFLEHKGGFVETLKSSPFLFKLAHILIENESLKLPFLFKMVPKVRISEAVWCWKPCDISFL